MKAGLIRRHSGKKSDKSNSAEIDYITIIEILLDDTEKKDIYLSNNYHLTGGGNRR